LTFDNNLSELGILSFTEQTKQYSQTKLMTKKTTKKTNRISSSMLMETGLKSKWIRDTLPMYLSSKSYGEQLFDKLIFSIYISLEFSNNQIGCTLPVWDDLKAIFIRKTSSNRFQYAKLRTEDIFNPIKQKNRRNYYMCMEICIFK